MPISVARTAAVGSTVSVTGVVTAEAGRLGTPPLLAIADSTAGIVVRLPAGVATPPRGAILRVRGPIADPYGQTEIRPVASDVSIDGSSVLPAPMSIGSAGLGESLEGSLVAISGRLMTRPLTSSAGDIAMTIRSGTGAFVRVVADASSGITARTFVIGASYRITGIVGQRASRKGARDGYRIWARDGADVVRSSGPSPSPTVTPGPTGSAGVTPTPRSTSTPRPTTPPPMVVPIATALRITARDVAIVAVVTAGSRLLDATGRRIVVEDASGAIEVLLAKGTMSPGIGTRVRVVGRVGTAFGAPRLRAEDFERLGAAAAPAPLAIDGALRDGHTWRLVEVRGRIDDVRKLGDRWRAEVSVGGAKVVVVGQPGAAIPVSSVIEGRTATIVGIVRRAFPSASDRRPSLLPRSAADLRVAAYSGAGGSTRGGRDADDAGGAGAGGPSSTTAGPDGSASSTPTAPDADLLDLASFEGRTVRVGGLVTTLTDDGFVLDDGTDVAVVVVTGAATARLPLIEPGDAVNVTGRVTRLADGEFGVAVDDPAGISLGSDPLAAIAGAAIDPTDAGDPSGTGSEPDGSPSIAGSATVTEGAIGPAGPMIAVIALLVVVALALVLATVRRRQARRLLAGRIAGRLAAVVGDVAKGDGPLSAESAVGRLAVVGADGGANVSHAR